MRELLEAVAEGEVSPEAAQARLQGYARTAAGRFDAAREDRRGVPEAILAAGKTPDEVADLTTTAVETTGRALVTRVDGDDVAAVRDAVGAASPDADLDHHDRSRVVVVHAADYDPPSVDATVGVVSAGTADAGPAGEAAVVARETGATVERADDVGVAALARTLDALEDLRGTDVLVVAAGREGALPTVIAGQVDAPVIGLPVASGYGHGGDGAAALGAMLQSCAVLSVVNVDAGFVAGAQAGLIARTVADARGE